MSCSSRRKVIILLYSLEQKTSDSSSVLIQAGSSSDPSIVEPSLAETVEEPVSRDQDDLTQLQIELLVETVMAKGRSLAERKFALKASSFLIQKKKDPVFLLDIVKHAFLYTVINL